MLKQARVCTVRFLASNVDPWTCRSMAVSNFMIGAFRMGHCFGIPRMTPELA